MQLQVGWVMLAAQGGLVLVEDAEDHSVHDQPAVFEEEGEEPLHLVQGDDLREESHDPVLAQDEDCDFFVLQVR